MSKYKQIYFKSLGYKLGDFIPSEISGKKAVDIHHIIGRGKKGGDNIENLIALTREEHLELGDKKKHMIKLLVNHRLFLQANGVKYNNDWFIDKINYYENIN